MTPRLWRQKPAEPSGRGHGRTETVQPGWYLNVGAATNLAAHLERGGYGVKADHESFASVSEPSMFLREVWWCSCDSVENAETLTSSWKAAVDNFIGDCPAAQSPPNLRYLGPHLTELEEDKLMTMIESSMGVAGTLETSVLMELERRYRPVVIDQG